MIVGREANDEHGSAMHLTWVERMNRGTLYRRRKEKERCS